MKKEHYWIKVSQEDFPHIAQAFSLAIAWTQFRDKKLCKHLAEVAGRVNGAEIKITNELLEQLFPQKTYP
tara:strand:+ start:73 stop:282 length:210 start_codon:yes stop_codon:yes gene_type:complete